MRRVLFICMLAISPIATGQAAALCGRAAPSAEQSWNPPNSAASSDLYRFYKIDDELTDALQRNDFKQTRQLAKEYLRLADQYQCNWNYGNAIHDANSALGQVSLSSGDTRSAVEYLLQSSKSPGSPQLDTFGPTMVLANKLVAAGEREAVITYLQGVHKFWQFDDGEVAKWIKQLKEGGRPDFRMQLH